MPVQTRSMTRQTRSMTQSKPIYNSKIQDPTSLMIQILRKNKIGFSNRSLLFTGQPKYLTQIKNLGIWETVLSFIPTYKSTDFFFNSIEKIISNDKASQPAINIVFKKNVIPSIEILRLFLALNHPVEN